MKNLRKTLFALLFVVAFTTLAHAQTPIPNNGFENWISYGNYSNPQYWDTPNQELMAIPLFGAAVVSKSTDHHSGSYSVKLESKHITLPPLDAPGFMTLGKLTLDIYAGTYSVTGGAPITDHPTHLQGYYKFIPKGGDSCLVAVGLLKTNAGVQDTVGYGFFSTRDTVNDWQFFSAWINYYLAENPDTMNVFAFSTAQETVTVGTVLYLDDLVLDYTVGYNEQDPAAGIHIYQDKETGRLILFFGFPEPQSVSVSLFNSIGQRVSELPARTVTNDRMVAGYASAAPGLYILEIVHNGQRYCRKFLLNF